MIYQNLLPRNEVLFLLNPQARLQRGNLLLKHGKLDEAENDFKRVVSDIWLALEMHQSDTS
jgi:hypothetical protein